jgi:hypothetical protein
MGALNTPGAGAGNNAAATSGPIYAKNNLNALQVFKQTLALDANGAGSNVLLMGGCSPVWLNTKLSTNVPDQVHIVLSSSLSAGNAAGLAEMNEFLRIGMHIKKIQIYVSANATTVFGGSLFIGEMPINGLPSPTEIPLQPYATTLGGGGYDNNLVIGDYPMVVSRNFYMYLTNVPASTTVTITYTIDYLANGITGNPTN